MATKKINITDIFEAKLCGLCGSNELSQFFGINDNFVEYCGVYYPFREILSESLHIHVSKEDGETMEICLDCKDKVLKFYHFKRKIKEAQGHISRTGNKKVKPQATQKPSKVVHSIYKIIENYTEKCSITKIRVDEDSKKLIIQSSDQPKSSRFSQNDNFEEEDAIATTVIKHEPLLLSESNFINESIEENFYQDDYDDTETDNDCSADYTASTSKRSFSPPEKKRKRFRNPKTKDAEFDIGTLDLSVVDVINLFNAETNKFSEKYGDVLRKLVYDKYKTRIVINFSFIGKTRVRATVKCEKCKQNYKIEGHRDNLVDRVETQFIVRSSREDFCRCGYVPRKQPSISEVPEKKSSDSDTNAADT